MSRVLFVVPPLTGHTNPTVGVGRALSARGHEVAWAAHGAVVAPLLEPGAELIDLDDDRSRLLIESAAQRSEGLRGAAALKFLWEEFLLPLGDAMVPGVEVAVDRFRPNVLVVDQQAIAGALVARRRGLPWVTSATTSAELVDPFALMPKLADWVADGLHAFQQRFGIPAHEAARGDLRFSDDLLLAFTTRALTGEHLHAPDHYCFVGPSLGPRPDAGDFPWDWLDPDRRHVLISLGTVNAPAGRRFITEAIAALATMNVQGIVVGTFTDEDVLPRNVLVRDHVPQLELLPQLDAVVSHAGHNTVCETLAHGLPLVVAPIRDDQTIVAQQVCDVGAARRVKFGRVRAPALAEAIMAVLDDPAYRDAADRIRRSFAEAGGADAAADAIERVVAGVVRATR